MGVSVNMKPENFDEKVIEIARNPINLLKFLNEINQINFILQNEKTK